MAHDNKLPVSFHKYFWDIDPADLDPESKARYIAERLLEYGDIDAFYWLQNTYGRSFLSQVVKESRKLSKKSANFFSLFFNIAKEKVLCLQEDFQNKHRKIWKH